MNQAMAQTDSSAAASSCEGVAGGPREPTTAQLRFAEGRLEAGHGTQAKEWDVLQGDLINSSRGGEKN